MADVMIDNVDWGCTGVDWGCTGVDLSVADKSVVDWGCAGVDESGNVGDG